MIAPSILKPVSRRLSLAKPRELDRVRLREDVSVEGGVLRKGSAGTVVYRYGNADAYEVEFTRPLAALVTLRPDQVERAVSQKIKRSMPRRLSYKEQFEKWPKAA